MLLGASAIVLSPSPDLSNWEASLGAAAEWGQTSTAAFRMGKIARLREPRKLLMPIALERTIVSTPTDRLSRVFPFLKTAAGIIKARQDTPKLRKRGSKVLGCSGDRQHARTAQRLLEAELATFQRQTLRAISAEQKRQILQLGRTSPSPRATIRNCFARIFAGREEQPKRSTSDCRLTAPKLCATQRVSLTKSGNSQVSMTTGRSSHC